MTSDLVVVGAGIVGLAHAFDAVERGLSVTVVERDAHATGASVRNFGHGCFTAQDGVALDYALVAREAWLRLAKEAGFWLRDKGTLVAARADDELAVLREFAEIRDVRLLSPRQLPVPLDGVLGAALLPLDIRVDPREAVHRIARYLAERGVRFHWSTSAHTIEPGLVRTSRGPLAARKIVVAVGHDVDRHFPGTAEQHDVRRCELRMLRVADPHGTTVEPAVLTGFSLLRYNGFARCPSHPLVRERLAREHPELVEIGLNLMFTQLPDGSLTIGDTHAYGQTVEPYRTEELDERVLAETARLLGVPRLTVLERWRGVYASAPGPFLVATPADDVRVVSVTSGIGMTTALGLAPTVIDDLFQEL
ncbi:TIGR03364 family FAD-dependent oxidoreductase [Lentzea tibetensis]|uniref:TIGR03364 family FAD-dependent oxidoreductase n=1 Tax=Lentzea tibetensis TaxID=2591470 RepID=A0A563ER97_9PSEU|nr:TIGR03364 family FAD-dependent oxidoreductase [Lentzea tibetensis]TWP50086.1 TIGR03364 family FAD-dependent oxidoreductase [Lentzea tibetensis]